MSLWRKKLVVHSNLAGVSNGHMQNPIMPLLPPPKPPPEPPPPDLILKLLKKGQRPTR